MQTEILQHILQQQKLLTPTEIKAISEAAVSVHSPFLHYLVTEKIVDATKIAVCCAQYFGCEFIELNDTDYDPTIVDDVTIDCLRHYYFIPIRKNNKVVIAISDPDHLPKIETYQLQTTSNRRIVFASYDQLVTLINKTLSCRTYSTCRTLKTPATNETMIVTLTNQIITDAIYQNASDIHFEPLRQGYRIRIRIDGLLTGIAEFPVAFHAPVSSRLKVLADLDIAEKRLPQDGRFTFRSSSGISRDCRISCCPTVFGEKIVIRLLSPSKNLLNFENLGFDEKSKKIIIHAIQQPHGLILVTGPTGSGKTVTLYTMLHHLNTLEKNISTIEDPVEIQLNGINQVNVNTKIGLDFAVALRTFLRQDPDVIMVGEIRDLETAQMAIRAAYTGHLVLATLHTNSAVESITRLINIGIEHFHIASTVKLIIAQRLVRRLCKPCSFCLNGYKGRTAIFEILPITERCQESILNHAPNRSLSKVAEEEGMQSLWESGLRKVRDGTTHYEELHRVLLSP